MSSSPPPSPEKKDDSFASLVETQGSWNTMVDKADLEVQAKAASLDILRNGMLNGTGTLWWLRAVAVALVLLGLSVFVWQQTRALPAPTPAELDQGRRAMLGLVNDTLVEHVSEHGGVYPKALGEVLPLQTEVQYSVTQDGYELSVQLSGGQRIAIRKP